MDTRETQRGRTAAKPVDRQTEWSIHIADDKDSSKVLLFVNGSARPSLVTITNTGPLGITLTIVSREDPAAPSIATPIYPGASAVLNLAMTELWAEAKKPAGVEAPDRAVTAGLLHVAYV